LACEEEVKESITLDMASILVLAMNSFSFASAASDEKLCRVPEVIEADRCLA
jgi:hypothetical protein